MGSIIFKVTPITTMVMLTPTIHTITYLVLCIHISLISQVAGASSSCTAERRGYSTLLFSHWEFCSWKVTKDLQFTNQKLALVMPDLFHCDGKCNTNNEDDQEWVETQLGIGGIYFNRSTGTVEREEYMDRLERDINTCFMDAKLRFDKTMCQRFEDFVTNCSDLIGECLGDVAMREVVLSKLLKDFGDFDYSASECKEAIAAASVPTLCCGFIVVLLLGFGNK